MIIDKHRPWFCGSAIMAASIYGLLFSFLLCAEDVAAATYYISPTGRDSNTGASTSSPWLTFSRALATTRCGDTLNLMDGVYGDGTNTKKIDLRNKNCSSGSVLTLRALNQRRAWVKDAGSGTAIRVSNSSYITMDGIVSSSRDNSAYRQSGLPVYVVDSHHVVIKNAVLSHPNRYGNLHLLVMTRVSDALVVDSEFYNFHRHAIMTKPGTRVTVRRVYCNSRIGGLAGGLPTTSGTNGGDACVSLYPCQDCIIENTIADGSPKVSFLTELNASGEVPLKGNKILGSIGYRTSGSNGIYINSRGPGLTRMPQDTRVENVVIYNQRANSAIRSSNAKNTMVKNVTLVGAGSQRGLSTDKQAGYGDGATSTSIENVLALNHANFGLSVNSVSWRGNDINSYNNRYVISPAPPAQWTGVTTMNPVLGACIAWVPDGSPMKGAGRGGKDIGANVLYRYENGVLTSVPLWNRTTGAFPHGALVPGLNNIPGQSLYDLHTRLNINRNGCSFPAAYRSSAATLATPNGATPL